MRGRHPKPAHLRVNRTKKAGRATLTVARSAGDVPEIPNPGRGKWHELTLQWWRRVWQSPMAAEFLPSDVDGLGRVAILVNAFYRKPNSKLLAEIRLQESRFGLSPLDRSRLQWEIARAEDTKPRQAPKARRAGAVDPRAALTLVTKDGSSDRSA